MRLSYTQEFSSFFGRDSFFSYICTPEMDVLVHAQCGMWRPAGKAQVAKLVDALFSGSSAVRCAGSNPVLGTKKRL
jgi:hypothetical protein